VLQAETAVAEGDAERALSLIYDAVRFAGEAAQGVPAAWLTYHLACVHLARHEYALACKHLLDALHRAVRMALDPCTLCATARTAALLAVCDRTAAAAKLVSGVYTAASSTGIAPTRRETAFRDALRDSLILSTDAHPQVGGSAQTSYTVGDLGEIARFELTDLSF
jgi:hypothetical protein